MEGLLLFLLLLGILYYIGPTLLRWGMRFLMGRAIEKMQQQASNAQRQQPHRQGPQQHRQDSSNAQTASHKPQQGEKIFKKTDGEYIDFEEVK